MWTPWPEADGDREAAIEKLGQAETKTGQKMDKSRWFRFGGPGFYNSLNNLIQQISPKYL